MLRLFSSFWVLIGVRCITEHPKFGIGIVCLDTGVLFLFLFYLFCFFGEQTCAPFCF